MLMKCRQNWYKYRVLRRSSNDILAQTVCDAVRDGYDPYYGFNLTAWMDADLEPSISPHMKAVMSRLSTDDVNISQTAASVLGAI